jgi:hypothetical protein
MYHVGLLNLSGLHFSHMSFGTTKKILNSKVNNIVLIIY